MTDPNLSRFLIQLTNFLDDLEDFLPEERANLEYWKIMVDFLKKSNPRLLCEQFTRIVLPYKNRIQQKDYDFFLTFNFDEVTQNDNYISKIFSLKKIWCNDFSQDTKDNIHNYVLVLIYLGEKVCPYISDTIQYY